MSVSYVGKSAPVPAVVEGMDRIGGSPTPPAVGELLVVFRAAGVHLLTAQELTHEQWDRLRSYVMNVIAPQSINVSCDVNASLRAQRDALSEQAGSLSAECDALKGQSERLHADCRKLATRMDEALNYVENVVRNSKARRLPRGQFLTLSRILAGQHEQNTA